MFRYLIFTSIIALISSCSLWKYQADYVEANPKVDTRSRDIDYQDKRVYSFNEGELSFDNLFDGARLNDCSQLNDSTYQIYISPENEPINSSPWYAFRIISQSGDDIWLKMIYENAKHRYHPKISNDGKNWLKVTDDSIILSRSDSVALFRITPTTDTCWCAAQEVVDSKAVYDWCKNHSSKSFVNLKSCGKSGLNKDLVVLDIHLGKKKKKPIVVILGRLHPPEVTGYYAMHSFVETIIEENELSRDFLEKYRVLVFPLVNPDGVDLGHWRHNAGGIDLNRDWGNYKQPEIRQIADYIVNESKKSKGDVLIGFDFHSTYRDIYYTNKIQPENPLIKDFKDNWLKEIENRIDGYRVREEASVTKPVAVSKSWFHEQLQAVGITYEIGDNTPREFIKTKGKISAHAMMQELLLTR